jgi:hypothetical protein
MSFSPPYSLPWINAGAPISSYAKVRSKECERYSHRQVGPENRCHLVSARFAELHALTFAELIGRGLSPRHEGSQK